MSNNNDDFLDEIDENPFEGDDALDTDGLEDDFESSVEDDAADAFMDEDEDSPEEAPRSGGKKKSEEDVAPAAKSNSSAKTLIVVFGLAVALAGGGYYVKNTLFPKPDETAYARTPLDTTPPEKVEVDFGGGSASVSSEEQAPTLPNAPSEPVSFDEAAPDFGSVIEAAPAPAPAPVFAEPQVSLSDFDELKALVAKNAKSLEDLVDKISAERKATSSVSKSDIDAAIRTVRSELGELDLRIKLVEELTADEAKALAEKKRAEALKASKAEVFGDRTRMPNLMVIETSADGSISIVKKVSDGRVFALFEGERILTDKGPQKVTKLVDGGMGIWVGEDYYIDADEPPVVQRPAPAPVAKPAAPKPAAPAEPAVSTEYSVNAVFNEGTSFGVINSRGDTASYDVGDVIPGLGKIKGLNEKGQLEVGSRLINPLY